MIHFEHKIKTTGTISELAQKWKDSGLSVVFTNGCFDLLHFGHIQYLAEAKALGDKLVVGLNSSDSVKRLKGKHRPIKDEKSRLYLLAALECVDAVVLFEEDTPMNLIKIILPDILVKGGDWNPNQIVGAQVVLENGGEVRSLSFVEGYSTTAIEEKIKKN
ncbi:MAG TPA: D-glycero-beta-D-manno-heptose 1-phosphate adenylyltransferase [Phaeodactylibacter sp.]|nr:D-glycero-beta-D-manno-heptose 1-phosphate adenylyltransferase [Phaeodactylibacter sp.]